MKNFTFKTQLYSTIVVACLANIGTTGIANANEVEEAAAACIEAARLIQEDDDLDGAIEEATWCLTGLNQLQEEMKLSLLPDELEGFKGGEISNQSLLGITVIERTYSRDGDTISMSLTTNGGAGDAAAGGGLGALAELGKLFGALSSASAAAGGGKKIRIQKRTVVVSDEGGRGLLNIELKSGGSLKVESSDLDSDALVDFMREFPIAELDDAMAK